MEITLVIIKEFKGMKFESEQHIVRQVRALYGVLSEVVTLF